MKILVTGGAGFIGSNLVDVLVEKGHDVLVIDNLSTGKKENVNSKAKFFEADITDKKIDKIFAKEKPEAVFHLAAQIDISKSVADPVWDADQNILGSVRLLENSKKVGVKKFIFSSTAAVYGDTDQVPTSEDRPLLAPSPYGIGKLATEKYLNYYYQTHNLPYVVLRYANVYGPRQLSKGEGGVVAIFSDKLSSGEAPTIEGDGQQTRDYVYVSDVVQANIKALESDKVGIYNISTMVETSVLSLGEAIKNALQSDIEFKKGLARVVDQRRSALDCSKAKAELGFEPLVTLEEGIKKTINWFKK